MSVIKKELGKWVVAAMNDGTLLSIVVPVYNTESYLEKCVESIIRQEYSDYELILVDDGSTDNSLMICRKLEAIDRRVKVLHKPNGGQNSARKVGLTAAKGKYIGFVDSDDWVEPEMFFSMIKAAEENNADIVICDNVNEYPERTEKVKQGIIPGIYKKDDLIREIYPQMIYTESGKLGCSPSLCTKIFKRDLLNCYKDTLDERIRLGEDAAWTYPCILNSKCLVYIGESYYYHYRIYNDSTSHKNQYRPIDDKIMLLEHLYKCLDINDYPCLVRQLYLYSADMLQIYFDSCLKNNIDENQILSNALKIKESLIWNNLLQKKENLIYCEKKFIYIFSYLKNSNKCNFQKMYIAFKITDIKQNTRIFLSKVKRKVMRGKPNVTR